MSDLRTEIIDVMTQTFTEIRDNPTSVTSKPVQLKAVLPRITAPPILDDSELPAVIFGYPSSRLVAGAFTNEEVNTLSLIVYADVPELPGMNILESVSVVEETMRIISHDLNAYTIAHENDYVQSVSLGRVFARDRDQIKYRFIAFQFLFQVSYNVPKSF